MRAEVVVKGIVQGVGFRPFIYRTAVDNEVVGYVRNRGDAGVEIVIEGKEDNVKHFIADLERKKPSLAQIYDLSVNYSGDRGEFTRFSIVESFEGGDLSGSVIPPDVAICDKCLAELRDPANRRHNYFFITCTECGPRYTIIDRLPYDRPNTTMRSFPTCEKCAEEYVDPSDRRFHAQTVACPKCGPTAYLTDNKGKRLDADDPIRQAGKLLEEGYIVAVKGYGGFHIATSATKSEPIARLRSIKHRTQKPFAVMARSLETAKTFTEISDVEEELLTSTIRPIILLKKSRNYRLSDLVAPSLHNVGVMLPYTGLHYMLFDHIEEQAFVMTSANPPSEPIVADNQEALTKLGETVDFLLFHNRKIAQRCDDSVLRLHGKEKSIIRRSRGYAPAPIYLKKPAKHTVLGVGAEENVNTSILLGDKAFTSQYIGDVEKLETLRFLEEATRHLLRITKAKIEAVACDLHPSFSTTRLAHKLGEELSCPVFPVQHHYAHILSLMGEKGLDELVGICCDGAGYGSDGKTWGGEILHCTPNQFNRLGHLQEQPMIGGDLATRHPLRMAAGILNTTPNIEAWIRSQASHLPHGEREAEIIVKQMKSDRLPKTSSCGRVLDAVSALLGICYERTYEGEPAMKLESLAICGRYILKLKPKIAGSVIDTSHLLQEIFANSNRYSTADLAYSAQEYLATSLAELAVEKAREIGVDTIGFSGGVAYNEHISSTIKRIVAGNGLQFLAHSQVPPGDGGISFGQAVAASSLSD